MANYVHPDGDPQMRAGSLAIVVARVRTLLRRQIWANPVLLGFLALTALFYAPILLGLRTFPDGDFTHHFLPFSLFQQHELLSGRLPVWNPYTYAGHPFLADVQAAVFYPVSNIVLGLTLPLQSAAARLYLLEVEAALHLVLAGIFVYLLVRDLTGNRWAAFIGGCTFAFSGYLTGYPPLQLAVLRTAIWLPLVLWCLYRAWLTPTRWRWWVGASLAYVTAFLAGHAQTFLYTSYVLAVWIALLTVCTIKTPSRARQNRMPLTMGLAAFLFLSIGISAAQLLPSLEFTRLSVRANVDYTFVSGGFPVHDTWQILLPGVLTQFSPLYVGVVGIGLALCAVYAISVMRPIWPVTNTSMGICDGENPHGAPAATLSIRATVTFFCVLTVTALILSYGSNGFLYPLFYRFAPGWNLFRGQERAAFLVALGLSVLAGYGAALLPMLAHFQRRHVAMAFGALVTAVVYSFGVLWQLTGHTAVSDWRYLEIAFVTLLLSMALSLMIWLEDWSGRRYLWLVLLTAANLFWANMGTNLAEFGPVRKTILAPEMTAVQEAIRQQGVGVEGAPGRVYNEFRVYDDYGMRLGVEDVWGSSPLRLARYAALFTDFPLDRMWRLTGVADVLTWRRELFVPSRLLAEYPQAKDTTYLHRLATHNPHAWVAAKTLSVTDDQAIQLLADHQFDLDSTVLLPPTVTGQSGVVQVGQNKIRLMHVAPNRVHVDVESQHGGILVLSENWMPGWHVSRSQCSGHTCAETAAALDGVPLLQPVRADLTLIGIAIPSGQNSFDLSYWPDSLRIGLWVSGATMALLGLAGGIHWRRRRKVGRT